MKSSTHSTFMLTMDILRTLSWDGKGKTIGEMQKMMFQLTYGQVKRAMDGLVSDGLLHVENVPYGKTGKNVYRLTENAAIIASDITQGCCANYNGGL